MNNVRASGCQSSPVAVSAAELRRQTFCVLTWASTWLLVVGALLLAGCRKADDSGDAPSNAISQDAPLDPTGTAPFASIDESTSTMLDAARDEAFELVEQGEYAAAEQRMTQAAEGLEPGSAPWAAVQFHLATVYLASDRATDAVDALERACQIQVDDLKGPAQRDRLTYLMNLGDLHLMNGQLDKAETVLRQGLEQRAAFYGTGHPGYAFGLEPLAKLLSLQGKHDEAIKLAEEAFENFRQNQHDREHSAVLIRAAAYALGGQPQKAFPAELSLSDPQVSKLTKLAIHESSVTEPAWSFSLLVALMPLVEQRLDVGDPDRINLLITLANVARLTGDHAQRVSVMEKVVEMCRRPERNGNLFDSLLALAWAQSDFGDTASAERTYAEALQLAEQFQQESAIAEAHRNWGLLLSESGDTEAARSHLTEAVAHCRNAGEAAQLARAEITLGIFLQHQKEFEQAKSLLQSGCDKLDPVHPDAICGRSHLQAVEQGLECGCGDTARVLGESLREYVLERLPKDLVKDVVFDFSGEQGPRIQFDTRRTPTEAEAQMMARIANEALAQFRRKLRESTGGSR